MPEAKRVFIKAKMNKDLEKRLIKNGEYLDARNVSVDDSEDDNGVGSVENVSGNSLLTDFGLTDANLEIVGFYIDTTGDRLFAFITNWNDISDDGISNFASSGSAHYIAVYNTKTSDYNILVTGRFLNFSKTSPILGINLIENLLFFTDNRNQPRRIDVSKAIADSTYYSKEENISILRYFPYNAPVLMQNQSDQTSANTSFVKYEGALVVASDLMIVNNGTGMLPVSTSYTVTDANYSAAPSGGDDAELTVVISGTGEVSSVTVASSGVKPGGENFKAGDIITIDRSFISPSATAGDNITVKVLAENLAQTSTMKDVTTQDLPNKATEGVSSVSGTPTDTIVLSGTPTAGVDKYLGATITQDGNATVSDKIVVYNYLAPATLYIDNPNSITLDTTDIEVGVNPYYDSTFTGDSEFLSTKFVKFSYRFKFEDDSYSLIAPFTQSAFVPNQNGYFLDIPGAGAFSAKTAESDELNAVRSTIIQFFENSIDQVGLAINMPDDVTYASTLAADLKVSEIDIIYKSSDQTSLKVIDTILASDLAATNDKQYVYTYNSQAPIRTLPESEIARVSDKAPIRAKAQEIAGNRVIYGNYLARYSQPSSLNYTASASEKSFYGQDNSLNQIQYPNHTLKQNRNYKVGIVLADKYGRQSDVITSENSTVFSDYRNATEGSNLISATTTYLGDSLKINFAGLLISENLYSETNPTGWYSYKVVVQQQEQDYYNVYLPSVLNDFPQAPASTVSAPTSQVDAFLTLFSDNVNKIPRDLREVGPVQVQFNSSVEMYGRVNAASYQNYSTNQQYYPLGSDKVVLIGTRDDIGLDKTENGSAYDSSPFYSVPSPTTAQQGNNPYIARVDTNKAFGAPGGDAAQVTGTGGQISWDRQKLCVYETKPFLSNIDIFYETSTSGLISDLNNFINKGNSTLDIGTKNTNIEVTYFNSFIVKKVVNSETIGPSTYPGEAVWPGLPWNPYGYPVFPQNAHTSSFSGVAGDGPDWGWYIEEARIRGGYNNNQNELGVRAYLSEFNDDELTLTNGLIYSGLYNSTTGFNDTNVFSVAETITKQLDPRYGPIQKFYTSDTNLIIFQEDKVNSVLIDKDAIYTADGNPALTASTLVLGQVQQYAGEYGISYSPLSFAQKGFRVYFTDSNRGTVLRLSGNGLTPIGEYGMRDFFRDNLSPLTDEIKQSPLKTLTALTGNNPPTGDGNFSSSSWIIEDLGTVLASSIELGMGVDTWYQNAGLYVESVLDVGSLTGSLTAQITKNPTGNTGGPYGVTLSSSTGLNYGQTAATASVTTLGGLGGVATVVVTSGGDFYSVGDVLTINGGDIGGTTGVTDAEITIVASNLTSISTTQKRVIFNKIATNGPGVAVPETSPISFYTVDKDKIIGGYDNYLDKYTLSIQPANSDTYHTITFNDSSNSWTSFWDYKPLFLNTLNSVYYTCNNAQIWNHYDESVGNNRGSFYGVTYKSKIEFVFNPNSSVNKVFKTINYEGSNGWEIQSIASELEGVDSNGNSYDDNSAFIYSYDGGSYTENGTIYRAGFTRKENKYMCNIVNSSTVRPDEVVFGDQMSGIKGYYTTVIIQNDSTTDAGGLKTLFAVSSNYVLSSN